MGDTIPQAYTVRFKIARAIIDGGDANRVNSINNTSEDFTPYVIRVTYAVRIGGGESLPNNDSVRA